MIDELKYEIYILKMRLSHFFINDKEELEKEISVKEKKLKQLIRIKKLENILK